MSVYMPLDCDGFAAALADYLEGDAPDAVRTAVEAHAEDCAECFFGIDHHPAGRKRTLDDVEGYKHEEIAEMLGVTSGATKAQLHRARLLLREALNR